MRADEDATRQYLEARKAIRETTDPKAFLRLGIIYVQGIGIEQNHTLACYFFDKAFAMGCEEAEAYIEQAYESGHRSIVVEVQWLLERQKALPPYIINKFKKQVERERLKKNYARLSLIRNHLSFFYPNYSQEKAIADLLRDRDSVDADIFYATCTTNNRSEENIERQDHLLCQLFAPITQDKNLVQRIQKADNIHLLGDDDQQVIISMQNFINAYQALCKIYNIEEPIDVSIDTDSYLPYVKPSFLPSLRRLAIRCLLSVRDVDAVIQSEYMKHLNRDEDLLNICEKIENQKLQLFLISFVELNINIEGLMTSYRFLLEDQKKQQMDTFVDFLNSYIGRLTSCGIKHHLPKFSLDNLPPIE